VPSQARPGHQFLVYQIEPGSLGEIRLLDLAARRIDADVRGAHPDGHADRPTASMD
jgi:hypothetical protein